MLDFYKGKTVLITGSTGFKGSWLCEILSEAGATVIGYALEPNTTPNLFTLAGLDSRITQIYGDVRDYGKVLSVIQKYRPEIVFHLAAQPLVLESYQNPRYTFETNIMGTVNVLESVRQVGCVRSFLNITTDKVYENNDQKDHSFKEDEKLDGYDPYSNSKSCSELVTHSYKKSFFANSKTAVSTARAGNVIGGGDFSKDRIIPDCVKAATAHLPIAVRNKYSTRPYQFVLEPLYAYLLIAQKQYEDEKLSGYYNVGPDHVDAITTGDLVNLFCSKWGGGLTWEDHSDPKAKHEAGYLSLDNSKIKKTLGWHPVLHVDEAIAYVVEWSQALNSKGTDGALKIMRRQIHDFFSRVKA